MYIYINTYAIVIIDPFLELNPKYNMCYCEECHKHRRDESTYKRGKPPKKYALPIGWARFSLRYVAINIVLHLLLSLWVF